MTDHDLLGVPVKATVKQIKDRWHVVALDAHPDRGGGVGEFVILNQAYKRLLAKAPECSKCMDVGTYQIAGGLTVVCVCKGGFVL